MNRTLPKAAAAGDLRRVEQLLADGVDVDWAATTGTGRTALHEAVIGAHAPIVALLIARGCRLDQQDLAIGSTALEWACALGHGEIARSLVAAGADIDRPSRGYLIAPLMAAAMRGHGEIVALLIAAGANLRAETADGRNALSGAEANGHAMVADLLRSHGLDHPIAAPERIVAWPEVGEDVSALDFQCPASVLRAFILSMHRWEVQAALQGRDIDWDRTIEDEQAAFAPYCTVKKRAYGRQGSHGTPPMYLPSEALLGMSVVSKQRVQLHTRQGSDNALLRHERLYVMLKKAGRWLIDSKKARPLGQTAWKTDIL